MAFFTVLLCSKEDKEKGTKYVGFRNEPDQSKLHVWYNKSPRVYQFFLERYSILVEMRFNLSAALTINCIVNISFFILICIRVFEYKWQIILLTLIYAFAAFFLYKLSITTDKDYKKKLENFRKHPID